ncbi:MAG: LysR family transcriptional regulator [Coriobacteriia bacterium]|nr:LysR family transcriptional regulator [Coriobacteriia bacterium]
MHISVIREFLLLADEMNFSNVAKSLFISQSALSKHIDAMETEIGVKLFVRDKHSVRLTDMGRLFQRRMRVLINEYDAALKELKNAREGIEKTLKVGYLYGACKDFIVDARAQFEARYPQTSLELHSLEASDGFPMLRANQFDMIVAMKFPYGSYSTFNHLDIFEDCLNVAVSRKHRLADRAWVTLDDIKGERILMPDNNRQPNVYSFYKQVIKDQEVWADSEESLRDINSAYLYLASNTGVAITFRHLKSYFDSDVVFLPLAEIDSYFNISAVWKIAREDDAILAFANCLKIAYDLSEVKKRQLNK